MKLVKRPQLRMVEKKLPQDADTDISCLGVRSIIGGGNGSGRGTPERRARWASMAPFPPERVCKRGAKKGEDIRTEWGG